MNARVADAVQETRSTCPYCGTGCGVLIEHRQGTITGVRGDPEHPANFGKLCSKGAALHLTTQQTGRARVPELRQSKADPRRPVSWDTALETAAKRFAHVIEAHGPDAVGFYISGQLLTEDYYVFNKLARALVGTNNIDSNSRLCMSSAVAAYKVTLGADAVPCCYEDFDLCDLMLFAGSNAAWAHPVLFRRIEAAKANNPNLKIIAVDPRQTDTTAAADLHLQIRPGSDVVLYSAMLHVLMWEGLTDPVFIAEHTTGFEAVRDAVREITPAVAAQVCGVAAEDIITAARWFGLAKAPLSLWCQGLNQSSHGTANGASLIHLHLARGKIGQPGMGPFSLTGQPNAMGGREVGAMANLLTAHRDLSNPEHRAEMARFWDVPVIPSQPGLTATKLFEAVAEGRIKALWVACTNPAHSLPDQQQVRQALENCEFVVLQEAFTHTETVPYADLLLPAATWGEKEGSVTNSERCITHLNAAVAPPGEARPDWRIAADFARALADELGRPLEGARLFPYSSAREVFEEHAASTAGRDMDITGLSYDVLDFHGPQQWPLPVGATRGTARLYQDQRFAFPDGKARFYAQAYPLAALTHEAPSARYPYALNSGRLRDQWHGMSRTGRAGRLVDHGGRPRLGMYPGDMALRGIAEGALVRVSNARGEAILEVTADTNLRPGTTYLPMHWGESSLGMPGVNLWMPRAIDPVSSQPELKHAAIRIEALSASELAAGYRISLSRAVGADEGAEQVLRWREALKAVLFSLPARPDWQSLVIQGNRIQTVSFDGFWRAMPVDLVSLVAGLAAAIGMDNDETLHYADGVRHIHKRARLTRRLSDDVSVLSLSGFLLAGETVATPWLRQSVLQGESVESFRTLLFAPIPTPPKGASTVNRTVCSCLNVGEREIVEAARQGLDFPAIQAKLKCGTGCGSCVPEIKRLIA